MAYGLAVTFYIYGILVHMMTSWRVQYGPSNNVEGARYARHQKSVTVSSVADRQMTSQLPFSEEDKSYKYLLRYSMTGYGQDSTRKITRRQFIDGMRQGMVLAVVKTHQQ